MLDVETLLLYSEEYIYNVNIYKVTCNVIVVVVIIIIIIIAMMFSCFSIAKHDFFILFRKQ